MTDNKYLGSVEIHIGERKGILCYDWTALAAVKEKFDDKKISNLFDLGPNDLADLLVIGFQKHSSDITKEIIFECSPPKQLMAQAVDKAFVYAHWGVEKGDELLKETEEAERQINENFKKKTQ